jgi:ESS family glutamate:Na+ symporter
MGATATAIANMRALTQRNGPAPQAFVIVPVVGAFFVDLMNIAVLTGFLSLPFMGGWGGPLAP